MRINAIKDQFNTSKNVNRFGHPMKKQQASNVNPMSVLSQKREIKKQLMGINNSSKNMPVNSVLDSSMSYLDSLREARNKTKNTVLEKKKIKYSYKAISSKIINCKKSYNAKEAISQAKREVARLKKLRSKGEYDVEELEAAIAHAQAMERVAKKKARHLEEEEMAKAAGGACLGELEESKDVEDVSKDELEDEELEELSDEEFARLDEEAMTENIDFEGIVSIKQIDVMMTDMLNEMSEEMTNLMDEMGLDELFDEMGVSFEKDMDPADLKMMMIKHRNKEMKDIAEADGEYLKAIFEMLERQKTAGSAAIKLDALNVHFDVSSGGMDLAQIANVSSADTPVAGIDVSV